jgi:STE24 endopeptidase
MRDFAARLTRSAFLQSWIYAGLYIVATAILSFPLAVYQGFFREHKYGLATQTFGAWLMDQGKGLMVGLILGALALAVLYIALRRAPRTWWAWWAAVSVVFLIVGVTIAPVFIEPLFNKYTVLTDAKIRNPILSMAHANGIPAQQVFVVDASKQSNRVSANVAGMFGTMRIALNDNLLKRASEPGIKSVMGHEMGHYVLNHIYEMIPFFAILLAAGFAFVHWGFGRMTANGRGERWGVRGVADPAGLPIFSILLSVYFLVLTPVLNTFIRSNEVEADMFGLNAAREPDGFAEVALLLGEYRKLAPGPVEEWIFFDHPSGRNRILAAMRWKAENLGKSSEQPAQP